MHEKAIVIWTQQVTIALLALIPNGLQQWGPPGCEPIGATGMFFQENLSWVYLSISGYRLGRREKQPDAGFQPTNSDYPSIVLEVGCSESIRQLTIDARLWLEHLPDVSQLLSFIAR